MNSQWWLLEGGLFIAASTIYWLIVFRVLGRRS